MAGGGWTIVALHQGAGHIVTYLNTETGDENLAGTFGPGVSIEEIIDIILANAEPGDWIVADGTPMLVAERPGNSS